MQAEGSAVWVPPSPVLLLGLCVTLSKSPEAFSENLKHGAHPYSHRSGEGRHQNALNPGGKMLGKS